MNIPQSIIDKIQKLYALSGNNPSEHEAALAAAKVKEMLDKYNLTLDTVLLKQEKVEQTNMECPVYEDWHGRLCNTIAKEFNCGVFTSHRIIDVIGFDVKTTFLNIYGLPSDVQVSIYTYEYLKRVVENLTSRLTVNGKKATNNYTLNYIEGVIQGIRNKFEEQRQHSDFSSDIKGKEIIVIKDALVRQYRETLNLSRGRASSFNQNLNARARGINDGKRIQINKGVTGANKGGSYLT